MHRIQLAFAWGVGALRGIAMPQPTMETLASATLPGCAAHSSKGSSVGTSAAVTSRTLALSRQARAAAYWGRAAG